MISRAGRGSAPSRLRWKDKPRTGFFLRAESFYNVATEIENLEREDPGLLPAYGGRSLHERSHGELFLDLVTHRVGPYGLYLLDEPRRCPVGPWLPGSGAPRR